MSRYNPKLFYKKKKNIKINLYEKSQLLDS